jgi:hypothetical protein
MLNFPYTSSGALGGGQALRIMDMIKMGRRRGSARDKRSDLSAG